MAHLIAVLPGDGIGPEVVAQTIRVVEWVNEKESLNLDLVEAAFGGAAIDACGDPLPNETLNFAVRRKPSCSEPSAGPSGPTLILADVQSRDFWI